MLPRRLLLSGVLTLQTSLKRIIFVFPIFSLNSYSVIYRFLRPQTVAASRCCSYEAAQLTSHKQLSILVVNCLNERAIGLLFSTQQEQSFLLRVDGLEHAESIWTEDLPDPGAQRV